MDMWRFCDELKEAEARDRSGRPVRTPAQDGHTDQPADGRQESETERLGGEPGSGSTSRLKAALFVSVLLFTALVMPKEYALFRGWILLSLVVCVVSYGCHRVFGSWEDTAMEPVGRPGPTKPPPVGTADLPPAYDYVLQIDSRQPPPDYTEAVRVCGSGGAATADGP